MILLDQKAEIKMKRSTNLWIRRLTSKRRHKVHNGWESKTPNKKTNTTKKN